MKSKNNFHSLRWLSFFLLSGQKTFLTAVLLVLFAVTVRSEDMLLVANKGDRTLSIINPTTGEQLAAVPEDGVTGHEVVASADGKLAFVPIYGNSGVGGPGTDGSLIRVIDLEKRAIVGTIDFGRGVRPHGAVLGPKNKMIYVTTELENCISIIDPKILQVVGAVPTGQTQSHMLAISSDGKTGYTANVGTGTVSVLDMQKGKVIKIIPISKTTQRISISRDDKWVFTSDQTKPQLAVIDTQTNEIVKWIEMPGTGYGTATTPDGRWLLVALNTINKVAFIDLQKMQVVQTLDVPKSPQEILVRPDGLFAYVSCDASKQVAVIDLKKFAVEKMIAAGRGADGLAWAASK
ncbi:MAG TPA: cytochrome D1 domain-containing protein [Verrucomicrobiae bacterium]|nr:cytochrome D1 domain-containing protein [Verrucomicrobiae bacterium]